jgi:hypothetical protein
MTDQDNPKLPDDLKIHYCLVESFVFENESDITLLNNHPTPGNVYRVIEGPGKNYFRLHVGSETNPSGLDGIVLGSTLGEGHSVGKWSYKLTVIDPSNLDQLAGLSPENLKLVSHWKETGDKDLITLLCGGALPATVNRDTGITTVIVAHKKASDAKPEGLSDEVKNLFQRLFDEKVESAKRFSENLTRHLVPKLELLKDGAAQAQAQIEFIIENDPGLAMALFSMIDYVASTYNDKYEKGETPNIARQLLLTNHGRSAMGFTVVKYIQRYITDGFAKSNNRMDLYKAIHYILFELQRLDAEAEKQSMSEQQTNNGDSPEHHG